MFAVGIDISKSKSVAAILNQDGSMHTSPFEFHHTQPELDAFIKYILNSKQSATILMENTGHYHYPVLKAFQEAGLPVCMVNAYQIKKFGDMDLRKAKTDKKDAVRIARYALEKSYSLVPYTSMEQKYEDLRFLARQYNQRMLTLKTNKVFLLNHLLALPCLPENYESWKPVLCFLSTFVNISDRIRFFKAIFINK